jgi:2-oxoglutarate ferredoxin oxidoreductase subunit gamma
MHLVAMNRPSLEKFAPMVKPGGVILVNSTLISIGSGREDVDELRVPVNDIAVKLGSVRSANIVALAAFVARSQIVAVDTLRACVKQEFAKKEKIIPMNLAAVDAGQEAAR